MHKPIDRIDRAEAWMVEYMADLLDIAETEVDTKQPFEHLGLDSAASVAFTSDLGRWLGVELDTRLMIENDCIDAVAKYLRATHGTAAA